MNIPPCDACGSETGVAEYPDGTLWGRPLRLCEGCRIFFDAKAGLERLGTEIVATFHGRNLTLEQVKEMAAEASGPELRALWRIRHRLMRRQARNQ